MDPEARQLIGAAVILAALGGGGQPSVQPAPRGRITSRGELAAQDAGRFRFVREGPSTVAVPPSWNGSGRR